MKNKNQRMLFTALGLGVVLLILCKDEIADVISSPNNGGSDTPTTGGGKGTPTPVGDSSPCGCNPLTDRNCHCSPQGGDALPSPPNDKGEVKFTIGGDDLSPISDCPCDPSIDPNCYCSPDIIGPKDNVFVPSDLY